MRHYLLLPATLVALFMVSVLAPSHTHAASISIAPLRQELTLAPGQAFTSSLQVHNANQQPTAVQLLTQSFNVTDENYDYSFAQTEDVKNWVSFNQSQLALSPGGTASTGYTMGVPASAEPGEKYIAIFASVEDKPVNNITSVDRVGLLLYITVSGNVTRRANVLSVHVPWFSSDHGAAWALRIHSTGSAHFTSQITTIAQNIFGHTVSTITDKHLILPGTIRYLSGSSDLGDWPGLYHLKFLVGQGDNSAYHQTRWVIYAPLLPTIILIVVVGVALTLLLAAIKKQVRRRAR